jgi:3-isopropylmalate/(R)-2-methylmalate dehydratase small subunit
VWALADYGFRAVIAPTFADIFYNNCFKNGVLAISLDEATVEQIFQRTAQQTPYRLTVDLESCTVSDSNGLRVSFSIDESRRHCLLHGLDDIALTLAKEDKIAAYEAAHGIG